MSLRAVAAATGCMLLCGCPAAARSDSSQVREDLTAALMEAAQNGQAVDLGKVVGGDWDRLTFVCPYEGEAVVRERLGFRWEGFPGEDQTEGMTTFVFTRADDVVAWASLPRSLGDPCGPASSTSLSVPLADAAFKVERTSDTTAGGSFHSLRQVRR